MAQISNWIKILFPISYAHGFKVARIDQKFRILYYYKSFSFISIFLPFSHIATNHWIAFNVRNIEHLLFLKFILDDLNRKRMITHKNNKLKNVWRWENDSYEKCNDHNFIFLLFWKSYNFRTVGIFLDRIIFLMRPKKEKKTDLPFLEWVLCIYRKLCQPVKRKAFLYFKSFHSIFFNSRKCKQIYVRLFIKSNDSNFLNEEKHRARERQREMRIFLM